MRTNIKSWILCPKSFYGEGGGNEKKFPPPPQRITDIEKENKIFFIIPFSQVFPPFSSFFLKPRREI